MTDLEKVIAPIFFAGLLGGTLLLGVYLMGAHHGPIRLAVKLAGKRIDATVAHVPKPGDEMRDVTIQYQYAPGDAPRIDVPVSRAMLETLKPGQVLPARHIPLSRWLVALEDDGRAGYQDSILFVVIAAAVFLHTRLPTPDRR